jgi:hypothetical protein
MPMVFFLSLRLILGLHSRHPIWHLPEFFNNCLSVDGVLQVDLKLCLGKHGAPFLLVICIVSTHSGQCSWSIKIFDELNQMDGN